MRRDNGTVWALGAAVALAGAAAAGRRAGQRGGSRNGRPVWPQHDRSKVVTGAGLEDYYDAEGIEAYADMVDEELAQEPFWYAPTEKEAASIAWAAKHGYDPAIKIHDALDTIRINHGGRTVEREAYLIDLFEVKRVMWVDQVDRIPNLSDYLPIQRMLWVMRNPDEDGWYHLRDELVSHLTYLHGDDPVFAAWDRLEGMIKDAYEYDDDGVREILQQATTPEAVYQAVWPQLNTRRGLGGRRRAILQFGPQRGGR
jgi:hypothetical protein